MRLRYLATRGRIFGFDLSKMRRLFGCRDPEVLCKVRDMLPEVVEHWPEVESQEFFVIAEPVLSRAVMEGVPFEELDREDGGHTVLARNVFAVYGQDLYWPDGSDDWRAAAFWGLLDAIGSKARGEATCLFSYLTSGRPIFGRRCTDRHSYYAYLSNAELQEVRSHMIHATDETSALRADRFFAEILDWFDELDARKLDLWLTVG